VPAGAWITSAAFVFLLALMTIAPSAYAAFPGENGKIAFERGGDIWTVNHDGTGRAQVTSGPDIDGNPAWSPDGQRIAYNSNRLSTTAHIWLMNADGSGQTRLTSSPDFEIQPTWSPDGGRIAYSTISPQRWVDIFIANTDGSGIHMLMGPPGCAPFEFSRTLPRWSPDGALILYERNQSCFSEQQPIFCTTNAETGAHITCIEPFDCYCDGGIGARGDWSPDGSRVVFPGSVYDESDGTGPYGAIVNRNLDWASYERAPANWEGGVARWSPDGRKLVWEGYGSRVYTGDVDGSNTTMLSAGDADEANPDWQPILRGYPRPKGASPIKASLVPAYAQCTAPNRTHGAPLSSPSCSPPVQASDELSLGTPDANGKPVKGIGQVEYKTVTGNLNTPADEADMQITVGVTDVYDQQTLADYTGELQVRTTLRITDKLNTPHPGGPGPGTVSDTPLAATASCTATSDTTQGASCNLVTSADAIAPGMVTEGRRANWELGQVQVNDGGADNDADSPADNTVFMVQGVFVP
jgi:hypothetical protein